MYKEEKIISKWISDIYDQDETDVNDVELLLSIIGETKKRVFEVACGSGRILVPLAKAGHDVTGIDFDEYMLSKINTKAVGLDSITYKKADAINNNWGNDYEVIVLAGNILLNIISDLNYENAQQKLIQNASNALVSGGHIFIDYGYTAYPENQFKSAKVNVVWEGKDSNGVFGRMSLLNSTYDKDTRINRFIRRFELTLTDGQVIKQDIPSLKHFATLEQIHKWLNESGFIIEEEYGDYDRNPISNHTNKAIIWARKK